MHFIAAGMDMFMIFNKIEKECDGYIKKEGSGIVDDMVNSYLPEFAAVSISPACCLVVSVMAAPPSMRDISSIRAASSSTFTEVAVRPFSTCFSTLR